MDTCDVTIPWTFSDWRRNAPYTELYLYIPYVGLLSLSPGDLVGTSNIHITASLDVISGDVLFEVQAGAGGMSGGHYIGQYGGNIAGAYAIGSSAVSIGQQVVTAIGATAAGAAIVATEELRRPWPRKLALQESLVSSHQIPRHRQVSPEAAEGRPWVLVRPVTASL